MKVHISTTISEEEKQELINYCEQHDITVSQLIRKALKEYLEQHR